MAETAWSHFRDVPEDDSFAYGTKFDVTGLFGLEQVAVNLLEFPPGVEGPLSYHHDPIEECYLVLDGKLDIQLDHDLVEADTGAVLYVPPGTVHAPSNPYDEPAVLVSIVAPPIAVSENTTAVDEMAVSAHHELPAPAAD